MARAGRERGRSQGHANSAAGRPHCGFVRHRPRGGCRRAVDDPRRRWPHFLVARRPRRLCGAARRRGPPATGTGPASPVRRHRHRGIRRHVNMAELARAHAFLAPRGTFHTMTTSEMATVLAWEDALNASDVDTLLALSSDALEGGDAPR